jgi:hypothetical protein
MPVFWPVLASVPASILVAIAAFGVLWYRGLHVAKDGKIASTRIVSVVTSAISAYIVAMCLIGQWYLGVRISATIESGFGNERFALLLVAFLLDVVIRIMAAFNGE